MSAAGVDASRCPLCGTPNLCAMALATEEGAAPGKCWCMQADFSLSALDRLPASARGLACICARCAANQTREKNPLS